MCPKKSGSQVQDAVLKKKDILSAIQKADVEAAKKALEYLGREDLCVPDKDGRTVLHRAAQYGNLKIVELVLDKLDGLADLDLQDKDGKTALHYSVEKDAKIEKEHKLTQDIRVAVFHLLQSYGADIRVRDNKQNTPIYLIKALQGKEPLSMTSARQYQMEKLLGLVQRIQFFDDQTLLHIAAAQNSFFGVKYILAEYPDVDVNAQTKPGGNTALMHALALGNAKMMEALSEHPSIRYDLINDDGLSLLHIAVKGKNLACVEKMITKGVDSSIKDKDGNTALSHAVDLKDEAIIKRLLQADPAVVNIANNEGITPLFIAVDQQAPITVVNLLLDAGANMYTTSDHERSPIIEAIKLLGDGEKYLERFFSISGFNWSTNCRGNNLLWYSIYYKNPSAFTKILEHAPHLVNIPDRNGSSLLDLVEFLLRQQPFFRKKLTGLQNQVLGVMQALLVSHKVQSLKQHALAAWLSVNLDQLKNLDIHAVDASGRNLLHLAAFWGDVELCRAVLKLGGDRNLRDEQGLTPLQYAAKRGEKNIVEVLLKEPVVTPHVPENAKSWTQYITEVLSSNTKDEVVETGVNQCDNRKRTFLHFAAFLGDGKLCHFLLSNGADPNFQDDMGWSPLHYAALANQASSVWALLGVEQTEWVLPDNKGESPVKKLVAPKEKSDAAILLTTLSDLRMKYKEDESYLPALHTLFSLATNPRVNWDVIEVFLKFADINSVRVSASGRILFSAMQYFSPQDFKRLISYKVIDINVRDSEDLTVLHAGAAHTNVVGAPAVRAREMAEKMKLLLDRCDMQYTTRSPMQIFQAMVDFRSDEAIKYLLKDKKIYLSEDPRYGVLRKCALHYISRLSASLLQFALEQLKVQLSPEKFQEVLLERNATNETILMVAAGALNKQSMQLLIEAGAPYDDYCSEGFHLLHFLLLMPLGAAEQLFQSTPEHVASVYQGLLAYFLSLRFSEPGFNQVERISGNTPLMIAVARNNVIAVTELLKYKGVDFTIKNANGCSVEDLLATGLVSPECRVLLEKYQVSVKKAAKPLGNAEKTSAETMPVLPKVKVVTLAEILRSDNPEMDAVQAALKHTDLNVKDGQGEAALHLAIRYASLAILKKMCEQKAQAVKFDLKNEAGDTPLHLAVRLNKIEQMQYLSKVSGQPFLVTNQAGDTPLSLAVRLGQLEMVKILWPLTKKREISSLLDVAVRANKPDVVRWLAGQTNVNWAEKNAQGETLVQVAAKLGYLEVLKALKGLNADFGVKDAEGNTVMHLALLAKQEAVYKWLGTQLFCVELLKRPNKQGRLPLHIAVLQAASVAMMKQLLEGNSEAVNSQDLDGNTPLHLALMAENIEMACQLLATNNLDLKLKNKKGNTYEKEIENLKVPVLITSLKDKMAVDLDAFNAAIDAENIIVLKQHNITEMSATERLAAFEYAVKNGRVQAFTYLSQFLTATQRQQQLALMCQQNNSEGVAACLSCDVTDTPQVVALTLEQSITTGNTTLFEWALSRSELDLAIPCVDGNSAIAYALTSEQPEMALALIAKATPEILAAELKALHLACVRRDTAVMAQLLGTQQIEIQELLPLICRKSIEWRNDDLLIWCVEQPETDLHSLLLATLEHAIVTGDTQLLEWTLSFDQLALNTVELQGMPVVAYAIGWGQPEIAVRLLSKFDDNAIAAKDVQGNTLLHWACYYQDIRVIEALLAFVPKGLELNANNQFLATAYGFFIEQGLGSQFPELNDKFIALGAEARFPQWDIQTKGDEAVPTVVLSRPGSPAVLLSQQAAEPPPEKEALPHSLWVFTC